MPGPLTYAAITIMTRDRLRQIRDAVRGKIETGASVREVERQVAYLADRALAMLSAEGDTVPAPVQLYGPPFGQRISRFALVGAAGPDIPGYAALNYPGAPWLRDTLHKGTPDQHREQTLVGSTRLPLTFWRKVRPRVESEVEAGTKRDAALEQMRAYVLGHLCHVAADTVSSPYIDDVSWHLGAPTRSKLSREEVIGAIEAAVGQQFFGRGDSTRGGDWGKWWPPARNIPGYFYDAWVEALEADYGGGARRQGLGGYEARRADDEPPELDAGFLKDGYATFRNVVETGSAWDLVDWMLALLPMYLPSLALMPAASLLPQGSRRFDDDASRPADYSKAAADYQMTLFPFAALSLMPFVAQIAFSFSYAAGKNAPFILSWISAGLWLVAGAAFFASMGALDADDADGGRAAGWVLLFVLPLVFQLIQMILTFVFADGNARRIQMGMASFVHIFMAVMFIILFAAFMHEGVSALRDEDGDKGTFAWQFAIWFVIVGVLWFLTAIVMRYAFNPRQLDPAADDFAAKDGHHVRLFDDTTLFTSRLGVSPTLADLHYPSGRRPLLKMWWTGAGTPTVASTRDTLVFQFGGGHSVTVRAPLAPTTAAEYAAYLQRVVQDAGNSADLHVERVFPEELDYPLPPGMTFSDGGDDQARAADHAAHAGDTHGLTEADPFVLHHAPKSVQSVHFDRAGPVPGAEGGRTQLDGTGTVGAAAGAVAVTATAGATPFTEMFRPGDLIEVPQGGNQRMVVEVETAERLRVATPFAAGVTPPSSFRRVALDRRQDSPLSGAAWTFTANPASVPPNPPNASDRLSAPGGDFGTLFRPGDRIGIGTANPPPIIHTVLAVESATRIRISAQINVTATQFRRMGEPSRNLYTYVSDGDDTLDVGDKLMNEAADLAALLCLGATSHLLDDADRQPAAPRGSLNRAYQVFRDWNLDRRRVNEWKMLVLGGAVSEKRGDATALDEALMPLDAEWALRTPEGEAISNELGWTQVLRQWVDMARHPANDAHDEAPFRPGRRSNLELSQALAYLLDMPKPA